MADIETTETRVRACLDALRPYLQADGGDVVFRQLRPDGVVELQWTGTCATCPMSPLTLRAGIERAILQGVPEVRRVEAVAV